MDLGGENFSPILEEIEVEESHEASSPPTITPLAQQGDLSLIQIVQQLEESRRETIAQLRKDKGQSEMMLREHIQRVELREEDRRRRKSSSRDTYEDYGGRRRHHSLPRRQLPPIKIPKFKGEEDPNIYLEWEQKLTPLALIHPSKKPPLLVLKIWPKF
ncbi:unnamed protein product [Sphenostylis stenocarpa]|uniref:Uncharacterized protein n=1 Tax=Sphenostylis stenocarpa TaxID=92480 RepID=A0AA86SPQ7_9FABA|nr:unnamed protein product [Sphenostylis stenocarpa]